MGNEKMDTFNKDSPNKVVAATQFSPRNRKKAQHVNKFPCCQPPVKSPKDDFYSNRSNKIVQHGIETEKYFAKQENTRNNVRVSKASCEELTSDGKKLDSSGFKPIRQKKQKSEKGGHVKTNEKKIFTQNLNKERLKYDERLSVQSNSDQTSLNTALDRKPESFAQSMYLNSYPIKNKIEISHENSKSCSSGNESINQSYEKNAVNSIENKFDVSTGQLTSKETAREIEQKQWEDLVLSTEKPAKHWLESDATNCLLNKGAIPKTSRYTQTSEHIDDVTSSFVTGVKEQKIHKTKECEKKHSENKILKSDNLALKNEMASDKNCKILNSESTSKINFHSYLKETQTDTNRNPIERTMKNRRQVSKESKANLTNEVNRINEHAAYSAQLGELVGQNLEHGLLYFGYSYLPYLPLNLYPFHPSIQNLTLDEYFGGYSDYGTVCRQSYNGQVSNESSDYEFSNVNYYQEQCNNLNDFIYYPANLNCICPKPPVILQYENGMVYYNYPPVECSCQASSIQ